MMEHFEQFGNYRLLERVAIGGMAEIFRASIRGLGGIERTVAIKRLHRHLGDDEDIANTLIDEARLAVQLNHANIGQVFDLGRIDSQYFLVMEYIDGSDFHGILRRLRDQNRFMPAPIACHAVAEMLKALDYAHNILGSDKQPLNLVHRDVSPQNLMLNTHGEVKLVDFGIAKARMRLMETQAGIIKGKFYYMSPEQAFGKTLDRRTDIFSAGMVLYELLTGRPAYDEVNDLALLKRVRSCDFPNPRSIRLDLEPQLDQLVMKALKREPQDRYQTAREFQLTLQDYLQRTSGQVTSYQMAEFLKGLMDPNRSIQPAPQGLTDRKDYRTSESSLIFDASHLALDASESDEGFAELTTDISGPNPFGEYPLEERTASQHHNPFAEDEPTYVFMRDDEGTDQLSLSGPGGAPVRLLNAPAPSVSGPSVSLSGPQPFINPGPPRHTGPQPSVQLSGPQPSVSLSGPQPSFSPAQGSAASMDTVMTPLEPHLRQSAQLPAYVPAPNHAPAFGGGGAAAHAPMFPSNRAAPGPPPKSDAVKAQLEQLKGKAAQLDKRVIIGVTVGVLLVFTIIMLATAGGDDKQPDTLAQGGPAPDAAVAQAPEHINLTVVSRPPNARVIIDGAMAGSTPVSIPKQVVGQRVKLKLERDGYEDWVQEVLINPSAPEVLAELSPLKRALGTIKIVTNPPGLKIEVDERYIGKSPTQATDLDLDKSHTVIAMMDDGPSRQEIVRWGSGDDPIKQLNIVFEDEERSVNQDLPEPPRANAASSSSSSNSRIKRRPARQTTAKRAEDGDKSLDIWGNKKAAQDKYEDDEPEDKAPARTAESGASGDKLGVWGGAKATGKSGYLSVSIKGSSGKVYVDDKLISSKTPLSRYTISPGDHEVKVYFTELKRYSEPRRISVNVGKTSRLTFDPDQH